MRHAVGLVAVAVVFIVGSTAFLALQGLGFASADRSQSAGLAGVSDRPFRIGMNLSRINYYTPQWWHVDATKWGGGGEGLDFSVLTLRSIEGRYPAGDYLLKFDGTGRVRVDFDGFDRVRGSGGTAAIVPVEPSGAGVRIRVDESDPDDPVRNIRFFMPGFDDGDRWHPLFLERLEPFSVLRMLNPAQINHSNVVTWDDRTPEDWPGPSRTIQAGGTIASYAVAGRTVNAWAATSGRQAVVIQTEEPHGLTHGQNVEVALTDVMGEEIYRRRRHAVRVTGEREFEVRLSRSDIATIRESDTAGGEWSMDITHGIAWEWMIDTCNELGADIWVCVPANADDDYIRNLAELIRDRLNPDLRVYVEWSNEVWNSGFQSFWRARFIAADRGISQEQAQAEESANVFAIFRDTFGDDDRIVRVLASQAVSPRRIREMVEHLGEGGFDAVSCATYFYLGDRETLADDATVEDAAELLRQTDVGARGGIAEYGQIARQYGVRFIAYEGGQHLGTNPGTHIGQLGAELQRHPAMGETYARMIEHFRAAGGDLLVAYSYLGPPSRSGAWGHLEYQDSDPETSPKYQTLIEATE